MELGRRCECCVSFFLDTSFTSLAPCLDLPAQSSSVEPCVRYLAFKLPLSPSEVVSYAAYQHEQRVKRAFAEYVTRTAWPALVRPGQDWVNRVQLDTNTHCGHGRKIYGLPLLSAQACYQFEWPTPTELLSLAYLFGHHVQLGYDSSDCQSVHHPKRLY